MTDRKVKGERRMKENSKNISQNTQYIFHYKYKLSQLRLGDENIEGKLVSFIILMFKK